MPGGTFQSILGRQVLITGIQPISVVNLYISSAEGTEYRYKGFVAAEVSFQGVNYLLAGNKLYWQGVYLLLPSVPFDIDLVGYWPVAGLSGSYFIG